MTHETKQAVKADIFRGFRRNAVARFNERMPEGMKIEDTPEGIMDAVDYVLDHADRKGERSGAILAAAMWMHGYLEEETYCKLAKMAEIVDSEVAAAKAAPTSAPVRSVAAAPHHPVEAAPAR